MFYSALAFIVIGAGAFQVVGIVMAWGLSCFVRWIQLQALINQSYKEGRLEKLETAVRDEVKRKLNRIDETP